MSSQGSHDAFSILLSQKPTKRRRSSSHFVLCPGGCGKHFLEHKINQHLDQCVQKEESKAVASPPFHSRADTHDNSAKCSPEEDPLVRENISASTTPIRKKAKMISESLIPVEAVEVFLSKNDVNSDSHEIEIGTLSKSKSPQTPVRRRDDSSAASSAGSPQLSTDSPQSCGHSVLTSDTTPTKSDGFQRPKVTPCEGVPDVFATMIQQSKSVFAAMNNSQHAPLHHCLHLDSSGSLSMFFHSDQSKHDVAWSATVRLRDRLSSSGQLGLASTHRRKFTPRETILTVSSSIGSDSNPRRRWVRQHTLFSVPVLKSMLQKSIRRRKPLPSVRLAMELADKSVSELLRRLPVIILEDSTLHPDFGLIVWLMLAESKDFEAPPALIRRVFQVVFDISLCQWSDSPEKISEQDSTLTLSNFHQGLIESDEQSASEMMINVYTMLVRADYGGMHGDVKMLTDFANTWKKRSSDGLVPMDLASRIVGLETNTPALKWEALPSKIHERAKSIASHQLHQLCSEGIEKLRQEDVCLEGIDFHCSGVINELLRDRELCYLCQDLLVLSGVGGPPPIDNEEKRAWLAEVFKQAMWMYSSGVNRRIPLIDNSESCTSERYSELWKELLAPKAKLYQVRYVKDRLAS